MSWRTSRNWTAVDWSKARERAAENRLITARCASLEADALRPHCCPIDCIYLERMVSIWVGPLWASCNSASSVTFNSRRIVYIWPWIALTSLRGILRVRIQIRPEGPITDRLHVDHSCNRTTRVRLKNEWWSLKLYCDNFHKRLMAVEARSVTQEAGTLSRRRVFNDKYFSNGAHVKIARYARKISNKTILRIRIIRGAEP